MGKKYIIFATVFIVVFVLDQIIKQVFLGGYGAEGNCISLVFTLNKGVAFSMFAFLGEYLKYIQIALIGGVFSYVLLQKDVMSEYYIPLGLILGGGVSNLIDRFMHGGVVDYVYWHCGFDFAIFNFADVMIDLGVAIILYLTFTSSTKEA
jgi:signal peptidase II